MLTTPRNNGHCPLATRTACACLTTALAAPENWEDRCATLLQRGPQLWQFLLDSR